MAPATTLDPEAVSTKPDKAHRANVRNIVLAVCASIYAIGGFYFSSHFTPGTTVDGIDAGNMTLEELEGALTERAASYTQTITDPNGFETTITAADIDLVFDSEKVATEALQRSNPALWLPYLVSPQHLLIAGDVKIDETRLNEVVETAVNAYNESAEPPTNASMAYDKDEKQFVVTPESTGTALDASAVVKASSAASQQLDAEVTVGDEALEQPAVMRDDKQLADLVDHANDTISKDLDITFGDNVLATLPAKIKRASLSINENNELVANWDQIYSWVLESQDMADSGNLKDDEHVWEFAPQTTTDFICAAIVNGDDQVEVALNLLETKPAVTPGAKERGRHIDVNLSTQFARFYDTDGTVIWESYFVSGNVAEGRDTPTGDFAIESKEMGRVLVGADHNGDGLPDYESYVSYWMPFLAGDWGLHDATWRYDSEFGGDTYQWNGSHGCINLPYYKAEELFGLCVVGDPVIVHY